MRPVCKITRNFENKYYMLYNNEDGDLQLLGCSDWGCGVGIKGAGLEGSRVGRKQGWEGARLGGSRVKRDEGAALRGCRVEIEGAGLGGSTVGKRILGWEGAEGCQRGTHLQQLHAKRDCNLTMTR